MEAEFAMKDEEKSKSVETFNPQESETFLGAVRPDWLAWLAIGGMAGIRTDGEIFRTNSEFFKWDQRQIDTTTSATQPNSSHYSRISAASNASLVMNSRPTQSS
jgi:hypothetical protein